jgi:peptidyl-prolyl cis-trans isomerase C
MAVTVNGTGITVPEFEAGVTRYQQAQAALGITVSLETANKNVIDEFIAILLMEQAATAEGYKVDEASLQSRIDDLVSQLGSPEALTAWQTAHGYTEATFRSDLRRQMAAAFMRDQITASVPPTAEQVHVIQILLYDEAAAQQALGYLKAGRDFNELAAQYDPLAKGELGWFPRGYLSDPAVEAAAFALQPGEYSGVIQTQAGYDILFVADRQPDRPLSPDALLTLQEHAVQDWLAQKRNESTILVAP